MSRSASSVWRLRLSQKSLEVTVLWLLNKHAQKLPQLRRTYEESFLDETALASALLCKTIDDLVEAFPTVKPEEIHADIAQPLMNAAEPNLEEELFGEVRDKDPSFSKDRISLVRDFIAKHRQLVAARHPGETATLQVQSH